MTIRTAFQSPLLRWLFGFGFWTLLGLSFASQFYLSSAKAGLEVTWRQAVSYALGDWYVFALLSVPAVRLARRFSFDSRLWALSLAIHIVASVAFSLAYMVLRATVGVVQSGATFADAFKPLFVKAWFFNLLVYWVILAVTQAFNYYKKYREREWRATQLEKSLAQAKLQALQMQLNPHFLFNTLNSISALMHKDVDAADQMVVRSSGLLRAALDSSDTQEVPLRQELDILQLYLAIEKTRFGDRLSVDLDIAPETLEARVPNLILQPLVENAIRHGIEPRRRPGQVRIHASSQNGTLSLQVSDNGVGLSAGAPEEGVGLSNTRARLRELYGDNHTFNLVSPQGGGLQIRMSIPFQTQSSDHEDPNHHRR